MTDLRLKKEIKITKMPYLTIPIIGILATFSVTFFMYFDFNIRMVYGYSLLCIFTFFYLCTIHFKIHLSKEKIIFFFLSIIISIFVFLGSSKEGTAEYAIGMNLCVLIAVVYEPQEEQYFNAMKIFYIFSVAFSIYSILTFIFPEVYLTFVKPIISEGSATYNEELLRDGYGIALGANVVFIDYIIATGLIFSLNCLFVGKKIIKSKTLNIINMIICFLGMLCVNRKGELLAVLITFFFLYRNHMKQCNSREKAKLRYILIITIVFLTLAIAYMAQKGYLIRFYIFFNKIIRNFSDERIDITSGRIIIWKHALNIFKKNPILGIGWEHFFAKIPEHGIDTVKVHNNFIQLLCETGVIGFFVIATPMILLLIQAYYYMKNYSHNKQNKSIVIIGYTTSFGIQFFFFILDFIDPCIYKMSFWPIYTISIMSLIFAKTYERN